jgi:hypothetical protein
MSSTIRERGQMKQFGMVKPEVCGGLGFLDSGIS